ncbi:MAG: hypothetical protein IJ170_02400 [Ruminococcus sp.]|nr:hypothetical protein [Ruminococcus sp.]MBQ8122151.1 hypothetical protein [Ruminococcus sp.]
MKGSIQLKRHLTAEQSALKRQLVGEIGRSGYKAVSFKLEGVLAQLPFAEIYDLFTFMEVEFSLLHTGTGSFVQYRLQAQQEAEKKTAHPSLERVYKILEKITKISPTSREKLMKRECELAGYFAFPRECGKALYSEAKKLGKSITIVADTIYPRSVVTRVLRSCGYEEYDQLIVTSEEKLPDEGYAGALMDLIIAKTAMPSHQILHIGGDVEADVETPILKGARAVLLSPTVPLMVKSGRLRGFIEALHVYDYDHARYFNLHCAFGLYAAYGFDIPQNKVPQSDFCGDAYMLGFMVLGPISMIRDFTPETDLQRELIDAMERNPECAGGKEDFATFYKLHFAGHLEKFNTSGCIEPLRFLEKHAAAGDRLLLRKQLSLETDEAWTEAFTEPKLAPVRLTPPKQNALGRLADKLFPPGTRVRNIVDGLLVKMKSH